MTKPTRIKHRRFPSRESGNHYKMIALNHFKEHVLPTLDVGCNWQPLRAYIEDESGKLMIDVAVTMPNAIFQMEMSFHVDSIGPIGKVGLRGPGPCPRGEPGEPGVAGISENKPSKYIHNPISQTLLEDIL